MGTELAVVFFATITGGIGIYTTALALGIRHGIDWDHIAAITDITSAGTTSEDEESWLLAEPGLQLTDESHHMAHSHDEPTLASTTTPTHTAGRTTTMTIPGWWRRDPGTARDGDRLQPTSAR